MCTHSTHYVVQGSFHNSTDCNPILNMPFLPHFRFQNYPNIYIYLPFVGFLHFPRFLFLISSLLLIKIEQTYITSRFIETAFNLFDVTGDGHINAKVFLDFWMVSINTMLKLLVTRKKVVNALVINLFNF